VSRQLNFVTFVSTIKVADRVVVWVRAGRELFWFSGGANDNDDHDGTP